MNHAKWVRKQCRTHKYGPIGQELSRIERNLIDVLIRWALSQLVLCIEDSDGATRCLLAEKNIYMNVDLEIGAKLRAMLRSNNYIRWTVDP